MKTITLLAALLLIFVSCHHSDGDPSPGVPKIKTITHGTSPNSDKEFYEYDALGRLISITITGHEPNHIQYIYLKDKIVTKSENGIAEDTLYLNDKGLVVSEMFGITNEYDAKGYLVKTTGRGSDGEIDLEDHYKMSEGNAVNLDVWTIVNEKLEYWITYSYEFLPQSVNTIGNENMGITFYGKQDKNLLSVSTEKYIGDDSSRKQQYLYNMDANNRVVKRWTEGYPETGDVYTYYE